MKLGLFGSGNTAAATGMALARRNPFEEIVWVARTPEKAMAALRDAGSAFPDFLARVRVEKTFAPKPLDIVAVLAGGQIPAGGKARDGLKENVELIEQYVRPAIGPHTVVVLLASPIDELTEEIAMRLALPANQIIGFGGDLDVRRLAMVLAEKGMEAAPLHIIGEHGPRAIPVYEGEAQFDTVATETRTMLKTLTRLAGPPRNLATGVLMAELLASLARPIPSLHHVCSAHPDYETYLTWPTLIGKGGVCGLVPVSPGPKAQQELDALLKAKHNERHSKPALFG